MSTKIYNGYEILHLNANLSLLTSLIQRIKPDIKRICSAGLAVKEAEICHTLIDMRAISRSSSKYAEWSNGSRYWSDTMEEYQSPASFAIELIREKYLKTKREGIREPAYDWEFEVCFLPCKGRTLALLYVEQKAYYQYWEKLPFVKDYHYQNQTDKPKNVGRQEWEKRGEDWDEALKCCLPGSNGLSMIMFGDHSLPFPDFEEVLKVLPTLKQRAARLAKRLVFDGRYSLEIQRLGLRNAPWHEFSHVLWETSDWIRTPDGKKELMAAAKEFRGIIPEAITEDDLWRVPESELTYDI